MTYYPDQQYATHQTAYPPPAPPKPRRWPWLAAIVISNAATVGITLAITSDTDEPATRSTALTGTQLKQAHKECSTGSLGDSDHTLEIDTAGEDYGSGTATLTGLDCTLDFLNAPRSVRAKMESTRALDGMQSATWGNFEASWTYHPDQGLDVIVTQR
jgi:hypothetical protein